MARRETILDLLERLAPDVGKAFEESIRNMRSDVRIGAVESAIAEYMRNPSPDRVQRVIGLLNLDDAYFAPLDRALRGAYEQGGDWAIDQLVREARGQGVQISARFNSRNERAERFVRDQSSRLITEVLDDQREAVRAALREGLERGTAPRTAARDIVGRVNRAKAGSPREGGILGLHSRDAQAADRALAQLRSGDSADLRAYLNRKRRDRRFDPVVRKALREGTPVPADRARAMVTRYKARLLEKRGEDIARTELMRSLHAAQDEGIHQLVDDGKAQPGAVKRVWDASGDSATRDSHAAMDGQVRGLDEPFVTGAGHRVMYPGDTSLGAPAEEVINERCILRIDVDFTANLEPGD